MALIARVFKTSILRKFLCTLTLAATFATGAVITVPVSSAEASTTSGTFRSYNGSQYHVYANGIDWSKPVGVVYYLDGDYWTTGQSKVWDPNNPDLQAMAKVANDRNLVFVPVISPDKDASGDGITWWQNETGNGNWFRGFASWFNKAVRIDQNNVWTIGYSGGAEIETFDLAVQGQSSWRTGGGSIMIGGGDSNGLKSYVSPGEKQIPYSWYVGTKDGYGVSWPQNWSAWGAAHSGRSVLQSNGYTNTRMVEIPNTSHYNYRFADILTDSLNQSNVNLRASGFSLRGAIGAYYTNHGGATVFGRPTTEEFNLIDGGVAQQFANSYTIYWSEANGVHPVKFSGGIGSLYRANNYEHGHGLPLTDETTSTFGGAYQNFRKANGQVFTYLWHPNTGTKVVFENGAIGHQCRANGGNAGWGYPALNEVAFANGAKQVFYNPSTQRLTVVYWSEESGSHWMNERGAIYARWAKDGDVRAYGFPVTDETTMPDGSVQVKFSGGATIKWTATGGTVVVK